jgi:ATP-dependent protease ClpP protease subunit
MPQATPPQAQNIQHVWCSATISKKMEDVLVQFVCSQTQQQQNETEYVVYLSTLGGNPFSAVNIYNFIKSLPQKTTVYNMGAVYSAGVPFFLSFKKRIGVPDCSFMIHQTTLPRTILPEQFNEADLNEQKASLSSIDDKTQKIIHAETNSRGAAQPLSVNAIRNAALKSAKYDADAALRHGFIDKIELPTLPQTGVLFVTDQYLATLPDPKY